MACSLLENGEAKGERKKRKREKKRKNKRTKKKSRRLIIVLRIYVNISVFPELYLRRKINWYPAK